MSDQNLFLPICGTLLFLLILTAAIFGMTARLRFTKRLLSAYRDREKIDAWLKTHGNKQRLLLLISLVSILGILFLGVLILNGIVFMSKILLILFIVLLLLGIISGALILIDLENLAK